MRAIAPSRAAGQAITAAQKYCEAQNFSAAAALCRKVLREHPDWPPALHQLGVVASKSGDLPGAIKLARRAVALDPTNAVFHTALGVAYRTAGRMDEAAAALERAIALDPHNPLPYYDLCMLKKIRPDDPHLVAMEGLIGAMGGFSILTQTYFNFALAKAYDDLGRYDDAFRHLLRGNTLRRSRIANGGDEALAAFDRVRTVFDRDLIDTMAEAGYRSEIPVFIVGMPRSGTTLVEQILASHPSVHGAGELAHIADRANRLRAGPEGAARYPECVRLLPPNAFHALGKTYVAELRRRAHRAVRITDKAVSHYWHVGLIRLALPDARIIHVRRNPLDNCLSLFTNWFAEGQDFSYDLGELGRYYRGYAGLMTHWRDVLPTDNFLEVRYEDVVADLETEARRLVAFCGLDWDPACLAFHETDRPIMTASVVQVRQPIYQTSRGRAERYRKHLGPLIAALGEWAPAE